MKDEQAVRRTYFDLSDLSPAAKNTIEARTGPEVIAGEDDRKDIFELDESDEGKLHRMLAASTVILTDRSKLKPGSDGNWKLAVAPFTQRNLPACSGERFSGQHTGGWCSGFLVGPDIVVTAGHCGESQQDIENTAYIFGFQVSKANDPGTTSFSSNQVYFGKELIAHDLSSTGDYAVVRLDRTVGAPGAEPLRVRSSGEPVERGNLGVIGYPSGLPVKVAFGSKTLLQSDQDPWLISNLDSYGGNSGSAVFNADGLVEGILVRGAQDYVFETTCFRSNTIADARGSEAVTKSSVFVDKIP